MSESGIEKVVIIGSGPAGWTAAIYAARASLNPVVYVGVAKQDPGPILPGGQLMLTTEVENYPGFPEGVTGPEMMMKFEDQAKRFGTRVVGEDIVRCEFSKDGSAHTLHTSDGRVVRAHAVIISTGATANWIGLDNEMRLARSGGGVSACAVCDGALPVFRNKPLAVVGGGDTAMEEALYLAGLCSKVTLLHRRKEFRASKIMLDRVMKHPKIEVVTDTVVTEVLDVSQKKVTGLRVKNLLSNEERVLAVTGLFVAIGHEPNTQLFKGTLDTDELGYLVTRAGTTQTNLEGVWACGDVQDHVYRQAVTAAGTGCMAAIEVERWLGAQGLH